MSFSLYFKTSVCVCVCACVFCTGPRHVVLTVQPDATHCLYTRANTNKQPHVKCIHYITLCLAPVTDTSPKKGEACVFTLAKSMFEPANVAQFHRP